MSIFSVILIGVLCVSIFCWLLFLFLKADDHWFTHLVFWVAVATALISGVCFAMEKYSSRSVSGLQTNSR